MKKKRITAFVMAFICVFSLVGALLPSGVAKAEETEYTITYDLNGGEWGEIAPPHTYKTSELPVEITTQEFVSHGMTSESKYINLTRQGYTFDGWSDEQGNRLSYGTDNYSIPENSQGNKIYVANWVPRTKSIHINNTSKKFDIEYEGGIVANYTYTQNGVLDTSVFQKDGFVLKGFYDTQNENGTKYIDENGNLLVTWNSTNYSTYQQYLYPVYKKIYDLELDNRNGEEPIIYSNIEYNSTLPNVAIPTKENDTFIGYYEYDTYFSNAYSVYNADGTPNSINNTYSWDYDQILYAIWQSDLDPYMINNINLNVEPFSTDEEIPNWFSASNHIHISTEDDEYSVYETFLIPENYDVNDFYGLCSGTQFPNGTFPLPIEKDNCYYVMTSVRNNYGYILANNVSYSINGAEFVEEVPKESIKEYLINSGQSEEEAEEICQEQKYIILKVVPVEMINIPFLPVDIVLLPKAKTLPNFDTYDLNAYSNNLPYEVEYKIKVNPIEYTNAYNSLQEKLNNGDIEAEDYNQLLNSFDNIKDKLSEIEDYINENLLRVTMIIDENNHPIENRILEKNQEYLFNLYLISKEYSNSFILNIDNILINIGKLAVDSLQNSNSQFSDSLMQNQLGLQDEEIEYLKNGNIIFGGVGGSIGINFFDYNGLLTGIFKIPNGSVNINLNGGTGEEIVFYNEDSDTEIPKPTKENYEFVGYTGNILDELTKDVVIPEGYNEDTQLTAHYMTKTIFLDNGNAQGTIIGITPNEEEILPAQIDIPQVDGYNFDGYFDNQNIQYYNNMGEKIKDWDKVDTIVTDNVLYAKYSEKGQANPNLPAIPNQPVNPSVPANPSQDTEPTTDVTKNKIDKVSPIIDRQDNDFLASAEDNANYAISGVDTSDYEPTVNGKYVEIYSNHLLFTPIDKMDSVNGIDKYLVLTLKANEGWEFSNELLVELSDEYKLINAVIDSEDTTLIVEYLGKQADVDEEVDDTPVTPDTPNAPDTPNVSDMPSDTPLGLVGSTTNQAPTIKPTIRQAESKEASAVNELPLRSLGDKTSTDNTTTKVADNPKTSDDVNMLWIVLFVFVGTFGGSLIILCKRY